MTNTKYIIVIWMMCVLLLSGCSAGYMYSSTYDPVTKKSIKIVYSPLFATDSFPLGQGAEFRVSVVSTGVLEPNYSTSKATAEVHFKNDSKEVYRIKLKGFKMLNTEFGISVPEIILKPGDRYDTKQIAVKAPTYDAAFGLELDYELNGNHFSRQFQMKRQTMEELKEKNRGR